MMIFVKGLGQVYYNRFLHLYYFYGFNGKQLGVWDEMDDRCPAFVRKYAQNR